MDASEGLPSLEGFARAREHGREEKRIVESIYAKTGLDEGRLYTLIHSKAGALFAERIAETPPESPDENVDIYCGSYLEVLQDLEKMSRDDIEAEIAFGLLTWQ